MKAKYILLPVLTTFGLSAFAGNYGAWFDKVDANADGYLSAQELGEEKAHKIDKLDLDGDRLISRDEFEQYKAKKKRDKDDQA